MSKLKSQSSKLMRTGQNYNPSEIESRWQKKWEEAKIYSPDLDASASLSTKKPFYNLMMFPYPSAEGMHVGNMYAFTGADVYGRFQRMQGFNVFEPIGLDGFGIHSENYAIKAGKHPVEQAKVSESNFYRQLRSIGNSFDWSRTLETYKPEYYKWTQWLFIQLFKAGLAYRKKAPVNFCPSDKTVLADEQIIDGRCERDGAVVEKRELEQWFFRITKYADRLLSNIDKLDWSEKVKIAQRQWIGKNEGTLIRFKIKDLRLENKEIEVFTTRADTLYGATFLVLAPEHPISQSIKDKEVQEYIKRAKAKSDSERIGNKEKTGVFSGLYAINPLNQEKIPIWIADYAIMGYGTGALFGDAHDERDVEFANKYEIALKPTLVTGNKERDKRIMNLKECFTGYGILINSGEFSGLKSEDAKKKITQWLSKNSSGGPKTTYHLRDWLISRQRYWGPPIPLVFCENCAERIKDKGLMIKDEFNKGEMENPGWITVEEKDLPVELPYIEDYKPLGIHSAGSGQAVKAPLASHPEFYKTKCPNCNGEAKRETDVSDTFLDSSWYFLRYLATDRDDLPFPMKEIKKLSNEVIKNKNPNYLITQLPNISQRLHWLPVDMYIGGAEHSVLHLLYARFITMALKDLGFVSFEEPFAKFRAHGLIVKNGAKMSKSRGNVVIPDEYVKKFGADTLRTYLMFMGPFSQGGDFRDTGIEGMFKFLKRVWTLMQNVILSGTKDPSTSSGQRLDSSATPQNDKERKSMMHKTIKKVTNDISNLSYNTAIAALMEWCNFLNEKLKIKNEKLYREEIKIFLKLLAPFAPHMTEELFQNDNKYSSIHLQPWPIFDPKFLQEDEVTIAVQVDGKLRDTLNVKSEMSKVKNHIEQLARESAKLSKHLEGKKIQKVIYVEGRVINFVTG